MQDLSNRYHWDAENRLILVEPIVATEGSKRVEFKYDYIGRRVSKQVWKRTGGAWTDTYSTSFVYDGWNLIEEVSTTGAGETATNHYTWGLDLSGSLHGVGGVGGLLAQTHSDSRGSQTFHYTYDLNGNVSEVLDDSGAIAAHYEYGPFGEVLVESFDSDSVRRSLGDGGFRFSTKYRDTETGLLYYGYRYYDPETGRWLNRDSIEESGGLNLYGFVGNDPVNGVDVLGMIQITGMMNPYSYSPMFPSDEYRAYQMRQQEVYARVYGQWIQDAWAAVKAGADMVNFLSNPAYDGIREEYRKKLTELAAKLAFDPCLRDEFLREIQSDVDAAWADLLHVTPDELEEAAIGIELTILTGALANSLRAIRGPSFIGKVNKYIDKFTLDKPHLAKKGGSPNVGGVAANTVTRTNAELVQEVANRAARQSFEGSARVQGTLRHSYADRLLTRYQDFYGSRGLSTEIRYLDGVPDVGGRGSIRLDVVEGDLFSPTSVFDYKFGSSGLTQPRIDQIRRVGGFGDDVPIFEIRPTQ
jgi:RHS repeat-associated protein